MRRFRRGYSPLGNAGGGFTGFKLEEKTGSEQRFLPQKLEQTEHADEQRCAEREKREVVVARQRGQRDCNSKMMQVKATSTATPMTRSIMTLVSPARQPQPNRVSIQTFSLRRRRSASLGQTTQTSLSRRCGEICQSRQLWRQRLYNCPQAQRQERDLPAPGDECQPPVADRGPRGRS